MLADLLLVQVSYHSCQLSPGLHIYHLSSDGLLSIKCQYLDL
jgi:hypothetical protein